MKPKVILTEEVFKKVSFWVQKSPVEVSGLGTVEIRNGVALVTGTMMLPQRNTGTTTDIEPEDVNRALFALKDSPGELRWWWHSHANMGVFWSGTDTDTIKKISHGGWFLSSVFNKKGETKSCFYSMEGMRTPWGVSPLFIDDLTLEAAQPDDPREKGWEEEYEKNILKPKTPEWDTSNYENWRKSHGGVWERTSENPTIPTGEPTATKPVWMTAKDYRKWRQSWKAKQREEKSKQLALDNKCDAYGFTQEERTILAKEGYSTKDVDDLFEMNFTPIDIIKLAVNGVQAVEAHHMVTHGYAVEDILEMSEDWVNPLNMQKRNEVAV